MSHTMKFAGGAVAAPHRALMSPPIDWSGFDIASFDADLLTEARLVWQHRCHTEFRSVQIMNRFVTEVVGAGDPIDVYAGAAEMVLDEIAHTALCAEVCRQLGGEPRFPDTVELRDPERYLRAPMTDRALTTAISMVAINETLSVAFINDLESRCTTPAIRDVLRKTIADETIHEEYGWAYIEKSLSRYPASTLDSWRHLVITTLAPHRASARAALADVPATRRALADHREPERAALGLHSPARLALVFEATLRDVLKPRLSALSLWPAD